MSLSVRRKIGTNSYLIQYNQAYVSGMKVRRGCWIQNGTLDSNLRTGGPESKRKWCVLVQVSGSVFLPTSTFRTELFYDMV